MVESGRFLSPPVPPRPALTGGYMTRVHSRFYAITTVLTAPAVDSQRKAGGGPGGGSLSSCLLRGCCLSLC